MKKIIAFIFFFGMLAPNFHAKTIDPGIDKMYIKEYYANGLLKSEGWEIGDKRIDFWKLYHSNGQVAAQGRFSNDQKSGYWNFYNENGEVTKEGHYVNGSAENWWIFYDIAGAKTVKFQFENNKRNGFSLHYDGRKLVKAKKYDNDEIIGEWTSIYAFKRDNPKASF